MSEIPRINGKQAVSAFQKAGFDVDRQSGSHVIMKKAGHRFHLSVPVHGNKILGKGLLGKLIESAGLTVDQFVALL